MSVPISGCVIAFNEEANIEHCLRSLTPCDETLVIDAHSTDRTREIAERCGARVIERDWPGYRSQREFAIGAATHDWILFLDADEQLSPELAAELGELRTSTKMQRHAAYAIPFSSLYFGRYLRHGDWHPDRHVRLFDRRRAGMGGYEIHEKIVARGPVGRLHAAIRHDSYRSLDDQLEKLSLYARLMAEAMHRRGKRGHWAQVFLNPLWRFLRAYVLRLGFLDGWRGLSVALIEARYVREKYLRLVLLQRCAPRD
ncbi:MAG: glycosyltransferase family 2 protein [Steroidobacteraceae bacterium]